MTHIINMIVAAGKDFQVGLMGKMPWELVPEDDVSPMLSFAMKKDMAMFATLTNGCHMIAGSKTYKQMLEAIGEEKLKETGRTLHKFSRSLYDGPQYLLDRITDGRPIWVVGGPQVYKAFEDHINGMTVVTMMPYDGPADTYM